LKVSWLFHIANFLSCFISPSNPIILCLICVLWSLNLFISKKIYLVLFCRNLRLKLELLSSRNLYFLLLVVSCAINQGGPLDAFMGLE
jgi:hypothetical protein